MSALNRNVNSELTVPHNQGAEPFNRKFLFSCVWSRIYMYLSHNPIYWEIPTTYIKVRYQQSAYMLREFLCWQRKFRIKSCLL